MKKTILSLCLLLTSCVIANAQKTAEDAYHDFTVYRTTKGNEVNIKKVKALLD